ncbi:MAG: MOSC domain-containing protein [Desulfobulbaceae bacterium]|nr:MOSC domain-containing protein [Desulfobulbaceae bacterium]HIJ89760.1 MOSC domain-containing protein [Deltaproteobacteria bacterium]
MHLISLNIGIPKAEIFHGKEVTTGLCKQPVRDRLSLTKTGFVGDGVQDRKHHGGEDKAVCVYSADHYPHWEKVLGEKLPAAAFGENLTVAGLKEERIHLGDLFRLGTALLQVSQPRQPCKTLAARYGRNDFVKLVVDAGYTGFYFRVIEEGEVGAGDLLEIATMDPQAVSIAFANRIFHHDRKNKGGIETVLAVPALSASWRESFSELLKNCDTP